MLKKIDRYRITGQIGRGGMAYVYRGYDSRVGRDVAIKVMQGAFVNDTELRKRFKREADSIAALEHPSIVPIYDFGYHDSMPYLVMRFMENGTLIDRFRKNNITLADAIAIINRIGRGLDEAHKRGIVHRDLKPSNILFDKYDNAYLGDFGIVKIKNDTAITPVDANLMAGTPSYMSPEQIRGEQNIDGRADLYGLGAILFEMLTGKRPFEADDPATMIFMHITMPVPEIHTVNPEMPLGLDALIQRAMAKDPEARYPNAAAMIDDLNLIGGGMSPGNVTVLPFIGDGLINAPARFPITPLLVPAANWPPDREPNAIQIVPNHNPPAPRRLPRRAISVAALLVILAGMFSLGLILMLQWGAQVARTAIAVTPKAVSSANPAGEPGITGQIAFVSSVTGSPDIYLLDLAGLSVTRLVAALTIKTDPAWSPEGQRIAFASHDSGQYFLYVASADGSAPQEIYTDEREILTPSWAPDGQQLVFVGTQNTGREIFTISSAGLSLRRLTFNNVEEFKPVWSPDGSRIAFYTGQAGTLVIMVMNADGTNEIVVTSPDERSYEPAWSPDGERIAFVSERDGNAEIYVMDPDGTDQVRLTTNEFPDSSPVWSPDGSMILFVSRRGDDSDIYTMFADGSGEQLAFDTPEDEISPAWQP